LTRLQNPPKEKMEAAAMYILKQPMQDRTMTAAINAALRHGASDKMVDAIAEKLDHSSWEVRVEVIKAFRILGPEAVGKHRSQLARLANDQAQPDAVREMAKNTLDGKEEKCVAIQSGGPGGPQIVQIPGCRPN
jgi:HEAT repeat protein